MSTITQTYHCFRGSRLDHAMGNTCAFAGVAIPPLVFGMAGLIYAMVVVNLFLVLSLLRTNDTYRRSP